MNTLLDVRDVKVHFPVRRGLKRATVRAVDGVDLRIDRGETLGLVGESGSGKSTIGRAVLRLVPVTAGEVEVAGMLVSGRRLDDRRAYRKAVQVVFQDPYSSLNPRISVGDAIAAPARRHLGLSRADAWRRATELIAEVGLDPSFAERLPHEFSGGQRQRIAIARALASEPDLIVCDEAVSALDVSTQAQVINLLEELQEELGVALLFIAHDLDVVRHVSDRVAVMYLGKIVETGSADSVAGSPRHPYTELLLAAAPRPDPEEQAERRRLRREYRIGGEPGSPLDPPAGCPFHTRCPFVMDICRHEYPEATPIPDDPSGSVHCHLHTSGPQLGGAPIDELIAADRRRRDAERSAT